MHGEDWIAVIIAPVMCFTGIIIFAIYRGTEIAKAKMRTSNPIETQQLRDAVNRLEQRVQSLESVVTSAEYQASQRVAKALEERTPPEIGLPATADSGGAGRVTAR